MLKNKQLRPAVFMHIHKTAGTAIVRLAREHYGHNNIISHGDHQPKHANLAFHDTFFTPQKILMRHNDKLFVSGHFGFDFCSVFMKNRFSFTFLRDPMERIVSFYYFCCARPKGENSFYDSVRQLSFEEALQIALEQTA